MESDPHSVHTSIFITIYACICAYTVKSPINAPPPQIGPSGMVIFNVLGHNFFNNGPIFILYKAHERWKCPLQLGIRFWTTNCKMYIDATPNIFLPFC